MSSNSSIFTSIGQYNSSFESTNLTDQPTTTTTTTKDGTQERTQLRPLDFFDYALMLLFLVGLFCNILSILVLRSKRVCNSNTYIFIVFMAISDIVFLLFKNLSNLIKIYMIPIYNMCIVINIVPEVALFLSAWMMILISVERAIAVILPLKVNSVFSKARCILISLFILSFFLLVSIGPCYCLQYSSKYPFFCAINGGQDGNCSFFYKYIYSFYKSFVGGILPTLIIIALNTAIIYSLYAANRARKNLMSSIKSRDGCNNEYSKSNDKFVALARERQITLMLITLMLYFIVLSFPFFLYDITRKLNFFSNQDWFRNRTLARAIYLPIDILHATNILCFFFGSQRFRRELWRVLCCSKMPPASDSRHQSMSYVNNIGQRSFSAVAMRSKSLNLCPSEALELTEVH